MSMSMQRAVLNEHFEGSLAISRTLNDLENLISFLNANPIPTMPMSTMVHIQKAHNALANLLLLMK